MSVIRNWLERFSSLGQRHASARSRRRRDGAPRFRPAISVEELESRRLLAATYLDVGTLSPTAVVYSDSVQGTDADYYRFRLADPSTLTAVLSDLTDWATVTLAEDVNGNDFIDTGESLESLNSLGAAATMSEPLAAGNYLLRVTPYSSNRSPAYSLRLNANPLLGVTDAGDTLTLARDVGTVATSPKTFADLVQLSDVDVYRFQLTGPSTVSANFSGMTEYANARLVRDHNGNLQIDSGETLENVSINDGTSLSEPLESGSYFLLVSRYSWFFFATGDTNTAYTLSLSATPIAAAHDAGGSLASAENVGVLTTAPDTVVDVVQMMDTDVYRFDLSAASTVTANFKDVTEIASIRLVQDVNGNLQIDSGEILEDSTFGWNNSINEPLAAGTYFIVIESNRYATDTNTAYTLNLSAAPIEGAQDAGGTLATARNAGTLTTTPTTFVDVVQLADVDAYRFELKESSTLAATFTGMTEPATLRLVRDLNNNLQIDSGEILKNQSALFGAALSESLSAGVYYLLIDRLATDTNTAYTLTLNSQIPPVPEIDVLDGTSPIVPGVTVVDFGTATHLGAGIVRTFTIKNLSTTDPLMVQPASVPLGAGFTIVRNWAVNQVVPPSGTATLSVRLDSATLGGKAAILTFTNDDADESPFNIRLSGSVVAPANYLPTITTLGDVAIQEDETTPSLPFVIGDVETPVENLMVVAQSSNTELVGGEGITFGGSGANRTITVRPRANQFGTAVISVTVADALNGRVTGTFTLTVKSVNDAPTISDIADVVIDENLSTGALAFDVGDVETSVGSLTVRGSSSVPSLVPESQIVVIGSGTHRTVTVTPAPNASGSTVITLTVTDGQGAVASDTFRVTVRSPNHLPSISAVDDVVIDEDHSTSALPVRVDDFETPASSLVVSGTSSNPSLLPDSRIVVGGTGANRTVVVQPAPDQFGEATVTLTVLDGNGGVSTETFVVVVHPVNDAPSISAVADMVIEEDQSTGPISVLISDPETPVGELLMQVSSSNRGLLPEGSIVVTGNGAQRSVTVTPALQLAGIAMITLTVTDGDGLVFEETFQLTVVAANRRPTITPFVDAQIDEDGALIAVPFAIGDLETGVGELVLVGMSSDTALVPTSQIVFGGSGANRLVTVSPAPNHYGVVTITLVVIDGQGGRATSSFVLTVLSVNDLPSITGPGDVVVDEDQGTAELTVVIGDEESLAENLVVNGSSSDRTLVPDVNIVITGSGARRTVVVTPAGDQFGTATITLSVFDGERQSTWITFRITVRPINDAPVISTATPLLEVAEDAVETPLIVVVGDAETSPALLFLSVSSSNLALLPVENIRLIGTGTERILTVTPVAGRSGTSVLVVTVRDEADVTSKITVSVTVLAVNDAPILVHPLANQTIQEDSAFSLTLLADMFIDEDAGDRLTYSAVQSDGSALPSWLVFSATTLTFSGVPSNADVGSLSIWVTVTDLGGATAISVMEILVVNVNDAPTLGLVIAPQAAQEDSLFTFVIPATTFVEVDAGDILSLVVTLADGASLPSWLVFDPLTWTIHGTPANSDVGVWKLLIIASDLSEVRVNTELTVVVANTNDAPTAVFLSVNSVLENADGVEIGSLSAVDEDLADHHSFVVTDERFEVIGTRLKLRAGVQLDFETTRRIQLSVTATDQGTPALSVTTTVEIVVLDANDPPVLVEIDHGSFSERVVGVVVGHLTGVDPDAGQTLLFATDDPRFEIAGDLLRLKTGVFVEWSIATEITVMVEVTDSGTPSRTASLPVRLTVLPNNVPWRNEVNRLDVNRDGFVVPQDVLIIINELNSPTVVGAQGVLPRARPGAGPARYYDVNGDGFGTTIDVLIIVNHLNQNSSEGEAARDWLFASESLMSAWFAQQPGASRSRWRDLSKVLSDVAP